MKFLNLLSSGYDCEIDLIVDFLEVWYDPLVLGLVLHKVLVLSQELGILLLLFLVEFFRSLEFVC